MSFVERFDQRPRSFLKRVSAGLLLIVALIDYSSGPEISSSIFYLIPVCFAALLLGLRAGLWMSVLSATAWLIIELQRQPDYSHPFIPYWNAMARLGIFLISAGLTSEMVARRRIEKTLRQTERELKVQIQERTAELERNIHLEKQILEISEREQRRIGQDLHDGLCQQLVSATFALAVLRDDLVEQFPAKAASADQIAEILNDSITLARNLARGLHPVRLEVDGLASALEELAGNVQSTGAVSCKFNYEEPLLNHDLAASANLYRIAQEAVTNALKHSGARNISIELCAVDGQLKLSIFDDGCGFSESAKNNGGMGLHIMNYRARMIGASLEIRRLPTQGTVLTCSFRNTPVLQNRNVTSEPV